MKVTWDWTRQCFSGVCIVEDEVKVRSRLVCHAIRTQDRFSWDSGFQALDSTSEKLWDLLAVPACATWQESVPGSNLQTGWIQGLEKTELRTWGYLSLTFLSWDKCSNCRLWWSVKWWPLKCLHSRPCGSVLQRAEETWFFSVTTGGH